MATCKELLDKYSTGAQHISPAAIHYSDGELKSLFLCKSTFGNILREYMDHVYFPPTDRCRLIDISHDGVIRTDMLDVTDEELEWASVEYILRDSMNKFFGAGNFVEFIVREN